MDIKNYMILIDCSVNSRRRKDLMVNFSESSFHRRVNQLINLKLLKRVDDKYQTTKEGLDIIKKMTNEERAKLEKLCEFYGISIGNQNKMDEKSPDREKFESHDNNNPYDLRFVLDLNILKVLDALNRHHIDAIKFEELLNIFNIFEEKNIDIDDFIVIVNDLKNETLKDLKNNIEKNGSLKNTIINKKNYLNRINTEINTLEKNKKDLNDYLDDYDIEPEQLTQLREAQEKLIETDISFKGLSDFIEDMSYYQRLGLNRRIVEIIAGQFSSEEDIFSFAGRINQQVDEGVKLKYAVNGLKKERNEIKEEYNKLKALIDSELKRKKEICSEIQKLTNDLERTKNEIEEIRKTKEKILIEKNTVNNEMNEIIKEKNKKVDEFNKLTNGIYSFKDEYEKAKKILEKNKKENDELMKNNIKLKESNQYLQNELDAKFIKEKDYQKSKRMVDAMFDLLRTGKPSKSPELISKLITILERTDGKEPDFRDPRIKITEEIRSDLIYFFINELHPKNIPKIYYEEILINNKKAINSLKKRDEMIEYLKLEIEKYKSQNEKKEE